MQMTMSPAVDAGLPQVLDIVAQQIAGISA
jgi:hypothetical protein